MAVKLCLEHPDMFKAEFYIVRIQLKAAADHPFKRQIQTCQQLIIGVVL